MHAWRQQTNAGSNARQCMHGDSKRTQGATQGNEKEGKKVFFKRKGGRGMYITGGGRRRGHSSSTRTVESTARARGMYAARNSRERTQYNQQASPFFITTTINTKAESAHHAPRFEKNRTKGREGKDRRDPQVTATKRVDRAPANRIDRHHPKTRTNSKEAKRNYSHIM